MWKPVTGGRMPSARALNELADTAERRVVAPGAGVSQGPTGLVVSPPAPPYVDAWTTGAGEEGGFYAWEEIYLDADALEWIAVADGRSGTADEAPAIERSASETVPEGTRIRLELDPSGEFYVFDWNSSGLTVEDSDSVPTYDGIHTIRFDQADGFALTNPSAGVVRIDFPGPTGAVTGDIDYVSAVSCTAGALSVTTRTMTFTNGILTGDA